MNWLSGGPIIRRIRSAIVLVEGRLDERRRARRGDGLVHRQRDPPVLAGYELAVFELEVLALAAQLVAPLPDGRPAQVAVLAQVGEGDLAGGELGTGGVEDP